MLPTFTHIYNICFQSSLLSKAGKDRKENNLEGNEGKAPPSHWYPLRSGKPKEPEHSFAVFLDLIQSSISAFKRFSSTDDLPKC